MRETHVRKEMVLLPVHSVTVTCDSCGKPIDYEEHYDTDKIAHELMISLDPVECVNFHRRRDYCNDCNTRIWTAINKIIGAEPWVERDKDYE